jgi:MFS family permease
MMESPAPVGQGARFIGCAAATLGAAVNGYTLCVVAGAVPLLSDDFDLTTLEKALVISLNVIGAMIGGIAGGIIADSLGRRPVRPPCSSHAPLRRRPHAAAFEAPNALLPSPRASPCAA